MIPRPALENVGLALKKESSYVPAYITMGDISWFDSHLDRAVEAYSRALTIDPNNFDALLRRAKVYMELNDHARALTDLEKATEVYPYSGMLYRLRAECFEVLGETEKARQDKWRARVFIDR